MNSRSFAILGGCLLLIAAIWLAIPSRRENQPVSLAPAATPVPTPSIATSIPPQPLPSANPAPPRPADIPPAPPEDSRHTGQTDLEKINLMLRDYRTLFGENPVGTNAEIMRAIMGANPRHAVLGPPEGLSLNNYGELLDQWGTPFFFHQMSGSHMELRSAGPDKKMGTNDDLLLK